MHVHRDAYTHAWTCTRAYIFYNINIHYLKRYTRTNLPTCLPAYLPTYLPTHLPTYTRVVQCACVLPSTVGPATACRHPRAPCEGRLLVPDRDRTNPPLTRVLCPLAFVCRDKKTRNMRILHPDAIGPSKKEGHQEKSVVDGFLCLCGGLLLLFARYGS